MTDNQEGASLKKHRVFTRYAEGEITSRQLAIEIGKITYGPSPLGRVYSLWLWFRVLKERVGMGL